MKYQPNLEIINSQTGEILDLETLGENIESVEFEELVERITVLKQLYSQLYGLYRVNEYRFIQEMNNIEARKYVNNEVEIRLSNQSEYEYDTNCVHELKKLVKEEDFNRIFKEQYKVNRSNLRTIYTLGGDIKRLIDDMETKIDKKPTVTIKKIKK